MNTIFEVVKAHGDYTALTDKHPAYEWTNGAGVNDFFGPEIHSIPVALPYPGCNPVNAVDTTPDDGWTTDLKNIQCYQRLHARWHAARPDPDVIRHESSGRQRRREAGGQWLMHVALLFSMPDFTAKHVKTYVLNQQVAPTIIQALGLDPNELKAAQIEGIDPLPF